MPLRPDFEPARGISVSGCPNCQCGSLAVRLHDANGDILSAILLPRAYADAFLEQAAAVRQQRKGGLGAIRCEESA